MLSLQSRIFRHSMLGVFAALIVLVPTFGFSSSAVAATSNMSAEVSHADAVNVTSYVAKATAVEQTLSANVQGSTSPTPKVSMTNAGMVNGLGSTGQTIGMKLPNNAKGMQNVNGVMVTTPTESSVATVTPEPGGFQVAQTLSGPNAPSSFSYKLSLPNGYQPVAKDNGFGSTIIALTSAKKGATPDATNTIGFINPAWAVDANGASVPTSYAISGKTVTQTVDTSQVTSWPVVADPTVSFGWLIYVHWFHKEVGSTLLQAFLAGVGAAAASACSLITEGLLIPPCLFLFGFLTALVIGQFQTAYNRGGGIVWEFTPLGNPYGFEYVGDNWS